VFCSGLCGYAAEDASPSSSTCAPRVQRKKSMGKIDVVFRRKLFGALSHDAIPEHNAIAVPWARQLSELGLGLLQDRDVLVGIFPQGEEVLIETPGLVRVSCQGMGAPQLQLGEGADRLTPDDARMINNFLELSRRSAALLGFQIRFAAQVNRI